MHLDGFESAKSDTIIQHSNGSISIRRPGSSKTAGGARAKKPRDRDGPDAFRCVLVYPKSQPFPGYLPWALISGFRRTDPGAP